MLLPSSTSVYRDLKLDNTLLDDHAVPWLKLCDFGFAKHWQANSNMDTMRIGTPEVCMALTTEDS
jgi:serine/threonine-protein kinase SRK2